MMPEAGHLQSLDMDVKGFTKEDGFKKQASTDLEKNAWDHISPTVNVKSTEEKRTSNDDFRKRDRSYGCFCYSEDNHTSVVGMRELVKLRGVRTVCAHLSEVYDILGSDSHSNTLTSKAKGSSSEYNQHNPAKILDSTSNREMQQERCLFAFPAQSNFSGKRYPLTWIRRVQEGKLYSELREENNVSEDTRRWYVLLDAASYVTTSSLDLTKYPADFVAISFYKMFGFPTGLGGCCANVRLLNSVKQNQQLLLYFVFF